MEPNTSGLDARWGAMLVALRAYRVRTGNVDVPRSFRTADGWSLGAWLHRQRSLHVAGTLPSDRAALLEDLGVRWRVLERARSLAALRLYLAEHGDLLVPADHTMDDGFPLGTWVQSRRAEYRREPDRTKRLWPELEMLPFEWRSKTDLWKQGIAAIQQYRRDFGDARVPHWFETADGIRLGKWLDTRRTEYRAGALAEAKVVALEAEGVEWSLRMVSDTGSREAREDAHFLLMLDATRRWISAHDGVRPPVRTVDANGRAVGRWFARLERQVREGTVPTRRQPVIEASGLSLRRSGS